MSHALQMATQANKKPASKAAPWPMDVQNTVKAFLDGPFANSGLTEDQLNDKLAGHTCLNHLTHAHLQAIAGGEPCECRPHFSCAGTLEQALKALLDS